MNTNKYKRLETKRNNLSERQDRNCKSAKTYSESKISNPPPQCKVVNNRTVVQLPLTASHPALGCRSFIACTNLPYAFWVTVHF